MSYVLQGKGHVIRDEGLESTVPYQFKGFGLCQIGLQCAILGAFSVFRLS